MLASRVRVSSPKPRAFLTKASDVHPRLALSSWETSRRPRFEKPVQGGASADEIQRRVRTPLDLILALDVEATCARDGAVEGESWVHEIIEFPVVALNTRTLEIECEFHRYVRPTEKPLLTEFCTELTGIKQEQVDESDTLDVVAQELRGWLEEDVKCIDSDGNMLRPFAFGTDGPWDIHHFVKSEFDRKNVEFPEYFNQWIDVRRTFKAHHRLSATTPLRHMLAKSGMPQVGRAHSGIADARNLVSVIRALLFARCQVDVNDNLGLDTPDKHLYRSS